MSETMSVLREALRRIAMSNHLARHGGSAVDWEKCASPSCVDARSALTAPEPRPIDCRRCPINNDCPGFELCPALFFLAPASPEPRPVADCGCVHHAEDGIPCPHDLALRAASPEPEPEVTSFPAIKRHEDFAWGRISESEYRSGTASPEPEGERCGKCGHWDHDGACPEADCGCAVLAASPPSPAPVPDVTCKCGRRWLRGWGSTFTDPDGSVHGEYACRAPSPAPRACNEEGHGEYGKTCFHAAAAPSPAPHPVSLSLRPCYCHKRTINLSCMCCGAQAKEACRAPTPSSPAPGKGGQP